MNKPISAIMLKVIPHVTEAIRQLQTAQDKLRAVIVRKRKDVNIQVLLTEKVDKLQRIIDQLDDYLSQ